MRILSDDLQRRMQVMLINEGTASEEMTVRAVYHICRHDEGKPCGPEQEI